MKKIFLLSILLLVPGCIGKLKNNALFKKKEIVSDSQDKIENNKQYDHNYSSDFIDYEEPADFNNSKEELDAFVLEDDESGFEDIISNKNQIINNQILDNQVSDNEELSFVREESDSNDLGDIYYNSAAYGLKNIYYDFGRYGIKNDQKANFEENISVVKDLIRKGYTIVLAGHACDSKGSSHERNITISSNRSQIIADRLISEDIDPNSIKVVGWGSEMKIVPFGNRIQQAPNRRVEFYAYPPGSNNN